MIKYLENDENLILIPTNISKQKFLDAAGVIPNSYFCRLLESIYDAMTSPSFEMNNEYKEFYTEYKDFKEFLYKKYPILNESEIETILEMVNTGQYRLIKSYMNKLMDYNIQNLFDINEKFVKIIEKLLKAEIYEN